MPSPERTPEYERLVAQETLIADATELICDVMERQGVSRLDLARRLGKSKGFVSQILTGERNMTLRTFADVLFALGHRAELCVAPKNAERKHAPDLWGVLGSDAFVAEFKTIQERKSAQIYAFLHSVIEDKNAVWRESVSEALAGVQREPSERPTALGARHTQRRTPVGRPIRYHPVERR